MAERWRVALITTIPPVADLLAVALRGLGHEPVAVISARRDQPVPGRLEMSDSTAPPALDVMVARDRWSMEPLLRAARPDLAMCWGFPWRIPIEALHVPRLGSINLHPALLPRHRGPIPLSWARTSLVDPGGDARRVEAGDGPIWIVASEPVLPPAEEPIEA